MSQGQTVFAPAPEPIAPHNSEWAGKRLNRMVRPAIMAAHMKLSSSMAACVLCLLTGCASTPHEKEPGYTLQEEAHRQTIARYESVLKEGEREADQIKRELLRAPVEDRVERFKAYQTAQEASVQAAKRLEKLVTEPDSHGSEAWQKELEHKRELLAAYSSRADQQVRQVYVQAFPKLTSELRDDIRHGRVRVGMTPEQVRIAWGKPWEIHSLGTAPNVTEQWVYPSRHMLYFESGKLTSFEVSGKTLKAE